MSNSATAPSFIMKTYLRQGATELPAADFRAGQGASRMSGGGGWKLRLPAQGLQPFQVASNFMFSAEAVIIIRSQITEWNALLQNMVDGDEHGVGHGHGRPVLSASRRDALVLGRKIRALYSAGRLGALHQHGLQRLVPLACLAVIPLPGTLVVARTDPSPGAQMCRGGEPAHI